MNFSPAESQSFVKIDIVDYDSVDGTVSHLGEGDEGTVWQYATSSEVIGGCVYVYG